MVLGVPILKHFRVLLWCIQVISLTATMLTMSSINEIMVILMAIKSNFIGFYDKQNHTLVVIPYKIYETCQRLVS